jgi:acyl-coenzyme A synthetase/AMP-(fatty) acid ligase
MCDEAGPVTAGAILKSQISLVRKGPKSGVAICARSTQLFIKSIAALDGQVGKLLLLSPELSVTTVQDLMSQAGVKDLITDSPQLSSIASSWHAFENVQSAYPLCQTKWLLTTSGTTAQPKIVTRGLQELAENVVTSSAKVKAVWGLVYEASRFAGIQVIFQSLLSGGLLIAPSLTLSFSDRISLLSTYDCSHLSATPTLWRRLLMSRLARGLPLRQITLGGESCDGKLLDALASVFPTAKITTIYASTEAGVILTANDGQPGYPVDAIKSKLRTVVHKIDNGVMWVRPGGRRNFINTGDIAECTNNRIYIRGRNDNIVNIGGIKVCIEDIESALRECEGVVDCHVTPKPSAITGTILWAFVLGKEPIVDANEFKREIRKWCRVRLSPEARPAIINLVQSLHNNAAGKLCRAE